MTLTAYLSFLSLGSSIEMRSDSDDEEHENQIDRLRRLDRAIDEAQTSVIKSVSQHSAPMELQASRKNLASGILTVGTVVTNYILCFPIVVSRHRLQAFPVYRAWERDTPINFIRRFWSDYRRNGLRHMYPGFGLGLLSQAMPTAYESLVNSIFDPLVRKSMSFSSDLALRFTGVCLSLAFYIFLYPFNRNALILRVQAAGTHQPIRSVRDFGASYKRELLRFLSPTSGPLPILSVAIPSSIMYSVTEDILTFVYNVAYKLITAPNEKARRRLERKTRRQHHNYPSPSRQQRRNSIGISSTTSTSAVMPEYSTATDNFTSSAIWLADKKREDRLLSTYYPEIVCGVIASLITRFVSYPIDSILFKLILQDSGIQLHQTSYTGFFDCISQTWRHEGGWRAFFPGWGGCALEIAASYLVLEGSWIAYQAIDWKIQGKSEHEPRSVRKARQIRERMGLPT